MHNFQVGDRVEVLHNRFNADAVERFGTIVDVVTEIEGYPYRIQFDDPGLGRIKLKADEIRLVRRALKEGDRVRVTPAYNGSLVGREGTVKTTDVGTSLPYWVALDGVEGERPHGVWFEGRELEIVKERVNIINDGAAVRIDEGPDLVLGMDEVHSLLERMKDANNNSLPRQREAAIMLLGINALYSELSDDGKEVVDKIVAFKASR